MGASYLLVIGHREALAWILREEQMAFPAATRSRLDRLTIGDELFLTTTRGCFRNPGKDRTRVIGRANVASEVRTLDKPVLIAEREFTSGCDLTLLSLALYRTGLELAPLVEALEAFPNKRAWAFGMRRALVPLPDKDAARLRAGLKAHQKEPAVAVPTYLSNIRPVHSRPSHGQ